MKMYEDEQGQSLWWIDYIEDEMRPTLKSDADLLLEHSTTDRLIVENLKHLKRELLGVAAIELPDSDKYWEELKSKVMNQISNQKLSCKEEKKPPAHRKPRPYTP